ncbi:large ribosomal subunit protein mL48 [Anopheles bellator]|uniref:large ribosomal subunit protein mL48 n=1 Tax=Anopheles bellator TaxID=139047 RepID=UPI0026497710|nr:large ribosomal subunit protein mL48 [Anopheles bellator]
MATRQLLQRTMRLATSHQRFYSRTIAQCNRLYEPDYLELLKPKYPLYGTLNFTIKGYDYPILESFQRLMHNVADSMDLEIGDAYAHPPQKLTVQKFKPSSSVVDSEYQLTVYERTVQIDNVQAPLYPIFLRTLQAALPEGVTLSVTEHTSDHEEARYVPDRDLKDLKQQLDEMGGPSKTKK